MKEIPLLPGFVLLQDFGTLNSLAGEIAVRHQRSINVFDVPEYPRLKEIIDAINLEHRERKAALAAQQRGETK